MRMRREVFVLAIDDILPNRFQPRIKFDEKAIMELAESIRKHGVIQPIIVRKISNKYEIIAGERRYKASIIAGRKTIPAIITDLDDKESAEIALIENVQRQDMTPIEEAISYKKILDMGYINQTELATKLGKTQSTVANKLRLLNLSEEVQDALLEEKISERHARSLLKVDKKDQPSLLEKIINERLTVRKTDQVISSYLEQKEKEGNNMNNEEINRNYNIPGQPIIDQTNPSFMDVSNIEEKAQDINPVDNTPKPLFNPFGGMEVKEEPVAPQPEPVAAPEPVQPVNPFEMPQEPVAQPINPFDANVEPIQPVAINPFEVQQPASVQPEPVPAVEPQPINPFGTPEPAPSIEAAPVEPINPFGAPTPAPAIEEAPVEPINPFGTPEPAPSIEAAPVEPQPMPQPEPVQPINPFGAPMSEPTQNVSSLNSQSFASTPNYPIPETQELTPLMPEQQSGPTVSINDVINEIRASLSKIEQYGYKVDSDELDLPESYEFTIKIQK